MPKTVLSNATHDIGLKYKPKLCPNLNRLPLTSKRRSIESNYWIVQSFVFIGKLIRRTNEHKLAQYMILWKSPQDLAVKKAQIQKKVFPFQKMFFLMNYAIFIISISLTIVELEKNFSMSDSNIKFLLTFKSKNTRRTILQ